MKVIASTPLAAEFWSLVEQGVLAAQRCQPFGHWYFPPTVYCPECGTSDTVLTPTGNRGRIYSWVVAHMAFDPEFAADLPYTIVAVDLDEGARVLGRWVEPSENATHMAAGLEVEFVPFVRDGQSLVGFRRVSQV